MQETRRSIRLIVSDRLGGAILYIGRRGQPRAMRTAKETSTDFHSMSDHPATAMFANRRHGLDSAFEAVEGVPLASCD